MRRLITITLPSCLALILCAGMAKAEITGEIDADIPFQFHVANTTLPAGNYVFRMISGTDMRAMTVTGEDGKTAVEFLVGASIAEKRPPHSVLVFKRYGHEEFLGKIFEGGSETGVEVAEPAREELRLQKKGMHPVVHSVETGLKKVVPK